MMTESALPAAEEAPGSPESIQAAAPDEGGEEPRVLSVAEVGILLEEAERIGPMRHALMIVTYETAALPKEIRALTVGSFLPKWRGGEGAAVRFPDLRCAGCTPRSRTVPISEAAASSIAGYLGQCRADAGEEEPLFPGRGGGPMPGWALTSLVRSCCRAARKRHPEMPSWDATPRTLQRSRIAHRAACGEAPWSVPALTGAHTAPSAEGGITVEAAVGEALRHLAHVGYAEETIAKSFRDHYRKLMGYSAQRGEKLLTAELAQDFLASCEGELCDRSLLRIKRSLAILLGVAGLDTAAFEPPDAPHPGLLYDAPDKLADGLAALRESALSSGLQPTTVKKDEIAVRKCLIFLDGRIESMEELSTADIDAYAAHLVATVRPLSVRREMVSVKKMVAGLVNAGAADPQVLRRFPILPKSPQPELMRILTEDELSKMMDAAAERSDRPKRSTAIIALLVQYMLRASDVVTMRIDDVRWRDNTIVVRSGKVGEERIFPLTEEVRYILLDYLKNERPQSESANMFIGCRYPHRELKSADSIRAVVKKAARDAGIDRPEEVHTHTLRRSGATMLMNRNVDYEVISKVLIHDTSGTRLNGVTMRYLGTHTERLRSVAMEVKPHASR